MKFNFKNLSMLSLAALLFSTPLLNDNANAQSNNHYPKEKIVKSKQLTKKLAKDGYVYRLYTAKTTKNSDGPDEIVPSKDKTDFKVKDVFTYSGVTAHEVAKLVSRKGRIVTVDFMNGFYNKNKNIKSLKSIIKLETKIMNVDKKHDKNLKKVRKIINHLKSAKDRKIALESYHQLEDYLNNNGMQPSLLIV
ncbi:hypothetical protein [Apilactobacillus timberlakei]|uniref:Uncharacterized protein n=1 Tax=Apilactobacillus timberlakei TaxID=2008380 RepID=A0ABY2YTD2_9LACO|nr:hypothetical protein [Apilactobacillus timberlakei]TPR13311.1 hypothetical protein DYZ97_05330 [Apilactobacillus timberlakei]TPR14356.1 hypothetical protein DY048_05255 [Apilactobacillus timberlakei]TPR16609.1 hypothetical protein DY052_03345 [Apilactobacillus timberlakei]